MKKLTVAFCLVFAVMLAGCAATPETPTKQPTLEQMQARCIARTSADTDTLKIELAGALIVVTDKTTGQVYYIDP